MKKPEINIDDFFANVDTPNLVWGVRRFVDQPELPMHVKLECSRYLNRAMTISTDALLDKGLHQRVSNQF